MTIASCIEKFKSVIDIDTLKSMAKSYEDKGMSADTAMVRVATEEITRLTKDRKDVVDLVTPKKEAKPEAEVKPEDFTNIEARRIVETDPMRQVLDENGIERSAKEVLDEAEARFQKDQQEVNLYKVAVACAIGVGE